MITPITATFPILNFPKEVDYPTQEDWAAFSATAELNYGILSGTWSDKSEEFKEQTNNLALEIQEIGENAFNAISLNTIEDLATYTGTGLVMVKDINRGGTFISKTAIEVDPNTGLNYIVDNWIVFAKLGGGFWVRQKGGEINTRWLDGVSNVSYFGNGTRTSRSEDAVIVVDRKVDDTINSSGHCFSDSSTIDRDGNIAYCSYDCRILVSGTESYNHFAPFQNGIIFDTSGNIYNAYGFVDAPTIKKGTLSNRFGSKINDIIKTGGTVVNNYGVYVESLINGTNNYAIYTAGDTPSVFEGSITAKSVTAQALVATGSSSVAGSISKNTTAGLKLQSIVGTTYDFAVLNPAESAYILANLTGTSELRVFGALKPNTDNNITLGGTTNRWSTIYAGTGTINTSDDREKTYLDITDVERQVALELKANMRKFKLNDAIEKKGLDKARIHFGTSAQTVRDIFEKHGLNGFDYAVLCYDEWEDEYENRVIKEAVVNEKGNIIKEAVIEKELIIPSGNRYGLRYEELLCFIISSI